MEPTGATRPDDGRPETVIATVVANPRRAEARQEIGRLLADARLDWAIWPNGR